MGSCPSFLKFPPFYEKIPENKEKKRDVGSALKPQCNKACSSVKPMWENNTVPYVLNSCLNYNKDRIFMAMKTIENYSRFRFVERKNEITYLSITKAKGCYYYEDGVGHRKISLDIGSENFGTVLHELLHAIGFPHEHRRPDRDKYIIIHWENIMSGMEDQFQKMKPNEYRFPLLPFDYYSIMIYGNYGFSKNGKKTMESRDGRTIPGTRIGLSKLDKERLRLM